MASTQFKVENYMAKSFITVEGKKDSNNFYIIREEPKRRDPVAGKSPFPSPGDSSGKLREGHAHEPRSHGVRSFVDRPVEPFQKNPAIAIIRFQQAAQESTKYHKLTF